MVNCLKFVIFCLQNFLIKKYLNNGWKIFFRNFFYKKFAGSQLRGIYWINLKLRRLKWIMVKLWGWILYFSLFLLYFLVFPTHISQIFRWYLQYVSIYIYWDILWILVNLIGKISYCRIRNLYHLYQNWLVSCPYEKNIIIKWML